MAPRKPQPVYFSEVTSNIKSPDGKPWTVKLDPGGNYVVGPNAAGKTMLEDAIRLALTGATRAKGREVKKAQDLAELGPPGSGEVFSRVTMSNGLVFYWGLHKKEERDSEGFVTSLKTSKLQHNVPAGFDDKILTWADSMIGALTTNSAPARAALVQQLAQVALTAEDVDEVLKTHAELRAAMIKRADALGKAAGLDRVLALQRMAGTELRVGKSATADLKQQVEEAPLPSVLDAAKQRLSAEHAAQDDFMGQIAAWVRSVCAGTPLEHMTLSQFQLHAEAHRVARDDAAMMKGLEDLRVVAAACAVNVDLRYPLEIRSMLATALERYDGCCPLCGDEKDVEAMRGRAGVLSAWIDQQQAASASQRELLTKATARAQGLIGAYCLDAGAAHAQRVAAAQAAYLELTDRAARAKVAAHATLATPPDAQGIDWALVQSQSQQVVNRLLKAATDQVASKAQAYLPADLIVASKLTPDGTLHFGVRAFDGYVHTWLSGWQEALVLAAYCMAAVEEGAPALYFMPDVSVGESTLKPSLVALGNAPVQWIWTGTLKPKGRGVKGINVIEVAERGVSVERTAQATARQIDDEADEGGETSNPAAAPPPPVSSGPEPALTLPWVTAAAPPPGGSSAAAPPPGGHASAAPPPPPFALGAQRDPSFQMAHMAAYSADEDTSDDDSEE